MLSSFSSVSSLILILCCFSVLLGRTEATLKTANAVSYIEVATCFLEYEPELMEQVFQRLPIEYSIEAQGRLLAFLSTGLVAGRPFCQALRSALSTKLESLPAYSVFCTMYSQRRFVRTDPLIECLSNVRKMTVMESMLTDEEEESIVAAMQQARKKRTIEGV